MIIQDHDRGLRLENFLLQRVVAGGDGKGSAVVHDHIGMIGEELSADHQVSIVVLFLIVGTDGENTASDAVELSILFVVQVLEFYADIGSILNTGVVEVHSLTLEYGQASVAVPFIFVGIEDEGTIFVKVSGFLV